MKQPLNVAITGAAGQIGYALAFRVASGAMLGADSRSTCTCWRSRRRCPRSAAWSWSCNDCAFSDAQQGRRHRRCARGVPRLPGRDAGRRAAARARHGAQGSAAGQCADLLRAGQGAERGRRPQRARAGGRQSGQHQRADRQPQRAGPRSAQLHRHDAPRSQPRAVAARREDRRARQRHPPHDHLGQSLLDAVSGRQPRAGAGQAGAAAWSISSGSRSSFIPTVQQRGAAVIKARGSSSAASAASAAIDHVRTWMLGTAAGDWISMAVPADGSYGIARGHHLLLPGDLQQRRLPDRAGAGDRRVQPQAHGCERTRSCARSATACDDLLGAEARSAQAAIVPRATTRDARGDP